MSVSPPAGKTTGLFSFFQILLDSLSERLQKKKENACALFKLQAYDVTAQNFHLIIISNGIRIDTKIY